MEVIKSAGVYNCHIDDLYKSAEPAKAQSTAASTEPPGEELFSHLPGRGTGLVGAGHSPEDTRIDLPIASAITTLSSTRDLLQIVPTGNKSIKPPSRFQRTQGLILTAAKCPPTSEE